MGFDAFISYRRATGRLLAQVIRDRLKEEGISCFLDLEEDRSGEFDRNLLTAIADAPYFILVLTKGALNRCWRKNDWVRREILAAVEAGKTIIPVLYEDACLPKNSDIWLPKQIRDINKQQAVTVRQEYLQATIDKIVDYMKDVRPKRALSKTFSRVTEGSVTLLKARLNDPAIDCVSMAFHAGAAWRRDSDKLELLEQIFRRNVRLRILVNSGEAAEAMCAHMKQPMKKYTSIGDSARDWQDLAAEHPDLMEVRVTGTPIMHRIYMAQGSDGTGMIDVKYYTYGNFRPDRDFRLIFEADTPEFRIYQEEFEYLWENAGTQDT